MTTMQLNSYDLATTYAQVLMPIDFSPQSWKLLSTARQLAEAFHAPLRVVHIDTKSGWRDAGNSQRTTHATPLGESLEVDDVAERDAATGIARLLGDDESSLLVMSTHGHSGIAELALGGTAKKVLRSWTGPLLTGGPQFQVGAGPIRRIVLCVGTSGTSTALLVDVGRWARALGARVELLSVTTPGSGTSFSAVKETHVRLQEMTGLLPRALAQPRIIRLRAHSASRAIIDYVDEMPGTLVAMATRARPASQHALLGSVATTVLRNAKSPVLLRRADQPT